MVPCMCVCMIISKCQLERQNFSAEDWLSSLNPTLSIVSRHNNLVTSLSHGEFALFLLSQCMLLGNECIHMPLHVSISKQQTTLKIAAFKTTKIVYHCS